MTRYMGEFTTADKVYNNNDNKQNIDRILQVGKFQIVQWKNGSLWLTKSTFNPGKKQWERLHIPLTEEELILLRHLINRAVKIIVDKEV